MPLRRYTHKWTYLTHTSMWYLVFFFCISSILIRNRANNLGQHPAPSRMSIRSVFAALFESSGNTTSADVFLILFLRAPTTQSILPTACYISLHSTLLAVSFGVARRVSSRGIKRLFIIKARCARNGCWNFLSFEMRRLFSQNRTYKEIWAILSRVEKSNWCRRRTYNSLVRMKDLEI